MPVVQVHSYTPGVMADATIEGQRMFVPEAPGNRHWTILEEWRAAGNSWPVPPQPTLQELKEAKLSELAALRWQCETGGVEIYGFTVKTDPESAGKLTAARVKAEKDPEFTVRWKAAPGAFFTLDAVSIVEISDAVLVHVQQCFLREDELTTEIMEAGTKTALAAIDITTGW